MTNRNLTAVAIRFAALLLFMKIFESFDSYFLSVYWAAVIPFFEEHLHTSFDKFYYSGTFLIIANVLISSILFFKADRIASKLVKEDSSINIGLTPEKLIKVILLTTGLVWLASAIYLLPDLCDYIQMMIAKINHVKFTKRVDFNPFYYILKTTIAILFIFRVEKISLYLEKKMNKRQLRQLIRQDEKHNR
jgi:hypothetical protein